MFDKLRMQVLIFLREEKGTIIFKADNANTRSSCLAIVLPVCQTLRIWSGVVINPGNMIAFRYTTTVYNRAL